MQVLAALAKDKGYLREIAGILKPEYFEHEFHTLAAETILDHWSRHKGLISREDLTEGMASRLNKEVRLKEGADTQKLVLRPVQEFVGKLWTVLPETGEASRAKALEFCRRQEVRLALRQAEELLQAPESDPMGVQSVLQQAFRRVAGQQDSGIDFFPDTEELPARLAKIRGRRIPTGFKALDRWMGGGMGPGTETVIMARPKGGKSQTLLNMTMPSLLRSKVVVYFTHEITESIIDLRYTARISGERMKDIENDPKIQRKAIRARAAFWATHKPRLFIKGYPIKTCTPEMMRNYLFWMEGEHGLRPDLIVVDYGDIVRSSKKFGGDNVERFVQADVYEQLRAMAQEFDCPLLTASQCNRSSVSKAIIDIGQLAEAFAKAAIADHLIAVCETPEEYRQKTLRLYYAASREGDTGRAVRIMRDWERCYMDELEDVSRRQTERDKEASRDE